MKHKRFDQIYAYTYWFKNNLTGQKYHGVRWGNVRLGLTPSEDFAKKYFSSGKLSENFKENLSDYSYKIVWTFDTIKEAQEHESKINSKLMVKDDWEVWNDTKAIRYKVSPSLGRKVKGTETARKIGNANKGKTRSENVKKKLSQIQREVVDKGEHPWQTPEHSKRTAERMTDKNPSHGGLSEEHKRKIGNALRGIPKGPMTAEHKKNLSKSLKGKVPWNKGLVGFQTVSEETRKKRSAALKGRKHSEETKQKMRKSAHGTKHLIGKKVCCLCCHREFDLGNYAKHIKKVKRKKL